VREAQADGVNATDEPAPALPQGGDAAQDDAAPDEAADKKQDKDQDE